MLKKDDQVTIEIEDIGTDGAGIGKADGYTLFVKDAVIGDIIKAKVIKAKKTYGYARLMEIITPSKDRVEPVCPVARQCGGCQIQQMSYSAQLKYKQKLVRDNLARIGGITDCEVLPVIGMENPFNYRNKAQYPVGRNKDGKVVIGFYAGRTHSIVDYTKCAIGAPENAQILEKIRTFINENNISVYDEQSHKGLIRHILIRTGKHTGQIMVCLIINGKTLPHADKLADCLKDIGGMSSIMININKERTNVILGSECSVIWGNSYIEDSICGIMFRISPLSFFQINPVQTEKLYSKALEYAELTGNETVWDLYCGIGTISLLMATKARKVYGVEIVPQAIEDAKNNALRNSLNNAEFFVGKAEEVVPRIYDEDMKKAENEPVDSKESSGLSDSASFESVMRINPDVVVVDPPRKGCDETLLDTIVKMNPKRIVYVSCDSATLARDLKYLVANGYEIARVQPVDQFAHTVHVETVVLLSQLKQKPDDYINVTIELDDVDITSAETKATYDEIKKYVFEHNAGMKVSNLYISQVKRKCGIEVGKNLRVATRRMDCLQGNSMTAATDLELVPSRNLPKNEDSRQPQCPEDKERAIVEALEHFKMIQQK
jgi:23S rRNA (uracil1939-C5)-methyltransferase